MGKMAPLFTSTQKKAFFKREVNVEQLEPDCSSCGLHQTVHTPRMDVTGDGLRGILNIAEAPGGDEDLEGKQLVGQAGQLYRRILGAYNIDLDRDFWKINAVNCRPTEKSARGGVKNRTPSPQEVIFCKPKVDRIIKEKNPRMIWLLGGMATKSFFGPLFDDEDGITRFRGLCIPDRNTQAWVYSMFHPSYVMRGEKMDKNIEACFDKDLERALWLMETLPERPQFLSIENRVRILTTFDEVVTVLNKVLNEKPYFFFYDYETNRIKPYKTGAKIASISFAYNEEFAVSFPYEWRGYWDSKQLGIIKYLWRKIMEEPAIGKMCHNLKMEDPWTRKIFGVQAQNWIFDSMVAAHVIDSRDKYTGLNFQLYLNFGIYPYDKFVKEYLTDSDKEGFNKVNHCNLEDLLEYGGLDSWGGYNLSYKLMVDLQNTGRLAEAYDFFHESIQEFSLNQDVGFCIDPKYYDNAAVEITNLVKQKETDLKAYDEAQQFHNRTGREIDFGSSIDMKILLYDIMGLPQVYTSKKNLKVDANTLENAGTEFTYQLIALRKLEKTWNTYIKQFLRSNVDGKIYPDFNLHLVRTYRSSSSDPNFQNIPKRDEYSRKIVRSGIIPRPGYQLLECDYKGIEVCINACYSQDPELIKYIVNPKNDMHKDQACLIWSVSKDRVSKQMRHDSKNGHVFPEFYGSYFKNTAKDLWERSKLLKTVDGEPVLNHLAKMGVKVYGDFEHHMSDVENKFWKQFSVHKRWRDEINQFYIDNGYVEMYHGFRRGGFLSRNECGNTSVQGTAYHCLQWLYNRISQIKRAEKWKSEVLGQIHDCLLLDVLPEERIHVVSTIRQWGERNIRDTYKWIIVPLTIEMEITQVDQSWSTIAELEG
jgi:uracil-DNA glycosylase family 4